MAEQIRIPVSLHPVMQVGDFVGVSHGYGSKAYKVVEIDGDELVCEEWELPEPQYKQRDPLQQAMVEDFHKILANSPMLEQAFKMLPDAERLNLENSYLGWAWQVSLAAAEPTSQPDHPDFRDSVGVYRAFGGFVKRVQSGRPTVFKNDDWVAMDRKSYDQVLELTQHIHDALVELKEKSEAGNDKKT